MSTATAEVEGWKCLSEGGAVWTDAGPPLLPAPARPRFFEAREIIRMLRDCGLSEATIAQVIGTTRGRLRAWEASLVRPVGVERLQDLASIVGYLLEGASAPRDIGRWLCSANRHLGGRRPIAVLARGSWPW
jgi:hypothetical protein